MYNDMVTNGGYYTPPIVLPLRLQSLHVCVKQNLCKTIKQSRLQ